MNEASSVIDWTFKKLSHFVILRKLNSQENEGSTVSQALLTGILTLYFKFNEQEKNDDS